VAALFLCLFPAGGRVDQASLMDAAACSSAWSLCALVTAWCSPRREQGVLFCFSSAGEARPEE